MKFKMIFIKEMDISTLMFNFAEKKGRIWNERLFGL